MTSEKKEALVNKAMVKSLHNLISAQGDAIIPNPQFEELAKPSTSYVIDRRSTRVPFLAPIYSPQNVQVARVVYPQNPST